jgi:hypothetical protein
MNARELRIWNYILDENGKIIRIESIQREHGYEDKSKFDDWCNLEVENGEIQSSVFLKNCNPIEITEEILLKAGFKYNLKGWGLDGTLSLENIKIVNQENGFAILVNEVCIAIVSFVHHLQNIIYDLTGKELEIEF